MGHCLSSQPPPCSAASTALLASEARTPPSLGQTVPEVPLANTILGWRSVLRPNQGWATPIPCFHPRPPDPLRPQSRAPALSSHPDWARPGGLGCGLPVEGSQRPAACPAVPAQYCPAAPRAWCPEEEVTDAQNKTCAIPLTSAPAPWLAHSRESTCQGPRPLSGQPPSSAGRAGPLQGPGRATAGAAAKNHGPQQQGNQQLPGARHPWAERGWVRAGPPGPDSSRAYRQGQTLQDVLSSRVCPHLSVCIGSGAVLRSPSRATRARESPAMGRRLSR